MAIWSEEKLKKGQERIQDNEKSAACRVRGQEKGAEKEQGREGSNFEESSSRGIREAVSVSDVYSDPVYREGDFVMILRNTRPGVSVTFSYDKEGKVMQVMDRTFLSIRIFIIYFLVLV